MISVGALLGSTVMLRLQNPFLALALFWGFLGIVWKRQADYPAIALAAQVGMVIVAVMFVYQLFGPKLIPGSNRRISNIE
jgi:hypothetical protein